VVCCSSSCAALFDFPYCCGVHLIHIEDQLFNRRIRRQRCRSGGMDIPITLILSYIFVGIMLLYAINLDAVSLLADSSFTFLVVLNDVIYRFKWLNIVLFLEKNDSNTHFNTQFSTNIFTHTFHDTSFMSFSNLGTKKYTIEILWPNFVTSFAHVSWNCG